MPGTDNESIDDDVDIVFVMSAQTQVIAQRHDFAVDTCTQVASSEQVCKQVFEFTLLVLHDRCENRITRAFRLAVDTLDDLIG